jgi:hypothetical protein
VRKRGGSMERGRRDIVVASGLSGESHGTDTIAKEVGPVALFKAFRIHRAAERRGPRSGLGGVEGVVEGLRTQSNLPAAGGEARTASRGFNVARHQGTVGIQLPTNNTESGARTWTEAKDHGGLDSPNAKSLDDVHGRDVTREVNRVIIIIIVIIIIVIKDLEVTIKFEE